MHLEVGDIAACYGTDPSSRWITRWTRHRCCPVTLRAAPSHVAMIGRYNGHPLWFESTTLCERECEIRGEAVSGCQAHDPLDRLRDYIDDGGCVDLYRLHPFFRLTPDEQQALSSRLLFFVRREADYDLGGALWSGTHVLQALSYFPPANLESLFCSEYLAAALAGLRMNRDNPGRFNPARLLRELLRTGVYTLRRRCDADWLHAIEQRQTALRLKAA